MIVSNNKYQKGFTLLELSLVIVVIGILIGAMVKATSLIKPSKIVSAAVKTSNSVVFGINEGPILWFETTIKENIELDSNNRVVKWKNLGRHSLKNELFLKNDNDAEKPVFKEDIIKGLPAIYFDGNTTFLELSEEIECIGCRPHTIFVVAHPEVTENIGTADLFSQSESGSSINYGTLLSITNNKTHAHLRSSETITVNTTAPLSNIFIAMQRYDGNILRAGTNGGLSNDLSIGGVRDARYQVFVGSRSDLSSSNNLDGYIGEIIVFDMALNDSDTRDVLIYLINKWGAEVKY